MNQLVYSIVCDNITVAGASTLIVARPPATKTGLLAIEARVGQRNNDTAEQIAVALGFKASAYQTVTSFTPNAISQGGVASALTGGTAVAAGTSGINASAEGAGTFTPIVADTFQNSSGWLWLPTEDERIYIPSGSAAALTLKLQSAPSTLTNWFATLVFREV